MEIHNKFMQKIGSTRQQITIEYCNGYWHNCGSTDDADDDNGHGKRVAQMRA